MLFLLPAMEPIHQDKRVSQGQNGDLYFSNVVQQDALTDYSCNARFAFTHTIQQKNPYTLKVLTSKYLLWIAFSYIKLYLLSNWEVILCVKINNIHKNLADTLLFLHFSSSANENYWQCRRPLGNNQSIINMISWKKRW